MIQSGKMSNLPAKQRSRCLRSDFIEAGPKVGVLVK